MSEVEIVELLSLVENYSSETGAKTKPIGMLYLMVIDRQNKISQSFRFIKGIKKKKRIKKFVVQIFKRG